MDEWHQYPKEKPPQDKAVMTMIEDNKGRRNRQSLKLCGRLWWTPNDSMYVYYTPTHWREFTADERAAFIAEETSKINQSMDALAKRKAAL